MHVEQGYPRITTFDLTITVNDTIEIDCRASLTIRPLIGLVGSNFCMYHDGWSLIESVDIIVKTNDI